MQSELKPCPFCGCEKILDGYIRDGREIVCGECRASVAAFHPDASKRAAERWNRRAEAALPAAEPDKPAAVEYRHPDWIWYCESTTGPMVTFGRWAKNPQQKRYKLAEIQPTEHDHPAPSVAVKALSAIANYRSHSRLDSDENAEAMERIAKDALSAQVQDVADKGWLVEHNSASTLIYCLKQDGLRKGDPVLVNDITIRIENANKSYHALGHIAEAILRALPAAPAKQEVGTNE